MKFNYSKLLGKIKENGLTQEQLAKKIGKSNGTLSQKLNGRASFTANEMISICEILGIPLKDIGTYFFAM